MPAPTTSASSRCRPTARASSSTSASSTPWRRRDEPRRGPQAPECVMAEVLVDDFGFVPQKVRDLIAAKREDDAVAYMHEFIRAGSVLSMISMADYLFDQGDQDASRAWMDRAENAIAVDDFVSPIYLASAFKRGLGRGEPLERWQKALVLLERVGESGNLFVMHLLMDHYLYGLNSAPKSRDRFLYWARRAAALGSEEAATALREATR